MKKTCKRCGNEWQSRTAFPKACPKCKSYDWNKKPVVKCINGLIR